LEAFCGKVLSKLEKGIDGSDDFVELFFNGDECFLLLLKEVFFK
jgi:hypothetical protein